MSDNKFKMAYCTKGHKFNCYNVAQCLCECHLVGEEGQMKAELRQSIGSILYKYRKGITKQSASEVADKLVSLLAPPEQPKTNETLPKGGI